MVNHPNRSAPLRAQRDELLAALKRAEQDLVAMVCDDKNEIDPAFALGRVQAAILKAEGQS